MTYTDERRCLRKNISSKKLYEAANKLLCEIAREIERLERRNATDKQAKEKEIKS